MIMDIKLLHGDCLELMKDIPDKSVDLILTDPPYNIGKAKWDKIPNYVEWCGKWFIECQRVLKDNGSFYWWQNDIVQIAQLMEWLRNNSEFVFNSFIVWDKGDFRAMGWKNPSEANNLRSWFNTCEYCLYYTFQDKTGLEQILPACFEPYLDYMTSEKNASGMNNKSINDLTGYVGIACHWFWLESQRRQPQPAFISEQAYRKLQSTGRWEKPYESLRDEYESLRQEYESLRQEYESLRYTHNLDTNHNNVWHSHEHNNGKQHPTQKPNDLMERIIKTSSNPGDTVLDLFMGSGSTGVACKNLNRNFIGMELDDKYFEIAKRRIEEEK